MEVCLRNYARNLRQPELTEQTDSAAEAFPD